MTFTEQNKQKALAIVRVFETGKAGGDFAAVAVLNDGAGVSYGINQFTHRSGALLAVVERYFALGGEVGRNVIGRRLELLREPSSFNIRWLAADVTFKKALAAAAISSEMKAAQTQIAEELYLRPAIRECGRVGFTSALSRAFVFDSMTHGSWEKIRDRVVQKPSNEKAWIIEYVRRRDAWLASIPRLAATRYRTRFFLNQIAISNWDLTLPLRVHGVRIDDPAPSAALHASAVTAIEGGGPEKISAVGPNSHNINSASVTPQTDADGESRAPSYLGSSETPQAQPPGFLDEAERQITAAISRYDQLERVINSVADRTDRAKALWTTIVGTIWQTVWAVVGWIAGIPEEVWLVVAVIAGALMLLYLYRQIELGKMRETQAD
jgi:hypothetical protein